ncbi:MAG: glutathione S-transferase family protein [Rhodobacteraceae bacterium]|nr:glutathione S-transferase family protein [Paracoccaceae bacterium]
MLTLLTYPGNAQTFSLSPFCVKAAMLLQRSGLPWKRQDLTDPRKMPNQKLPVLKTPERLIPDSGVIQNWLEAKGMDFDPGLSALAKAQSLALIRMAEEHLYFQIVLDRWCNDQVWPVLRETFFGEIPAILRRPIANGIRTKVLRGLDFQGAGRYAPEQRKAKLEADLAAIAGIVRERGFLMGGDLTSADYSVAPMVAAMVETPVETDLVRRVSADPVLMGYVDRVKAAVPLA